MPQRVAITGASGLIGGALSAYLRGRGDEVIAFVRREPTGPHERRWRPEVGGLRPDDVADCAAIVHLAGAGVGDRRWTPSYKREILDSRVKGTRAVAEAVAGCDTPPRLVCGSAIGVYGDRGDEVLTESSTPGDGFLAEVVRAWEGAADPARGVGASVVHARTGLVFASAGGALSRLLPLARLGLAGPLGSGRQWWSWISLPDEVRAIAFLLDHPQITGPVNLVGPSPARQRDVVDALADRLGRPSILPAPAIALRVALGEFADDILASQRVAPHALRDNGFEFEHDSLDAVIRSVTP